MKIEDRIETLEKELDKLKALYSGLHEAVVKECWNSAGIGKIEPVDGKSTIPCEHDWTNDELGDAAICAKCCKIFSPDKPTPPCEHEWISGTYDMRTNEPHYFCKKCNVDKIKDKPTQTLEQKITEFLGYYKMADLAKPINEWVNSSLQSEYQRGKEEGYRKAVKEMSWPDEEDRVRWIAEGRKQAIEEMKEKFERAAENFSGSTLNHKKWMMIDLTRHALFTPDK